jgi:uncharacterized protein (TIGR01777 family)
MTIVFIVLTVQCLLGAFDNLWHHELSEDLPHLPAARAELGLHTIREFLYAVIFSGIAWLRWEGVWALVLVTLLGVEIVVTLADFIVEDRTRRLPPLERCLHTILAINIGATLAVWVPQLREWLAAPTGLSPVGYGVWSWLMGLFGLGAFFWAVRDLWAVVQLGVPAWQRAPMRAGLTQHPRTVLVTGATGLIGRALTRALVQRGDRVIVLTRHVDRARDLLGPLVEVHDRLDAIRSSWSIDAIVNLAGESIAGGWWTAARKRRCIDSRLAVTTEVLALIDRLAVPPDVLISASAVGYYGDRGDEIVTETSDAGSNFTAELCDLWETAALGAAPRGVRVCCLRIGLVLASDGGVLRPLARATRGFAGAIMGDGRQFVSWIHRADLVRLILGALDNSGLSGALNAVAPGPVRQADFMRSLGRALGRPILATIPARALRLGLGDASDLFLGSQRVRPARVMAAGFAFDFPALDQALGDLLGPPTVPVSGRVVAYVNDRCPVCRTEMGHYRTLDQTRGGCIDFVPIDCVAGGLPECGLAAADLRRRLFVRDRRGVLWSGIDALMVLWDELPGYRRLAGIVRLPGIRHAASLAYEGACVPILAWWTGRRGVVGQNWSAP